MAHDPVVATTTRVRDSLEPRFVLADQEARARTALDGYRGRRLQIIRVHHAARQA